MPKPPSKKFVRRAERVRAILPVLKQTYPNAKCSLDFAKPLELLVATILSAQCTDERVNLVTKALFKKYQTPAAYADAPAEDERSVERRCIVSRAELPAEAMIRFVRAPDGAVVADLRRRLPGRGANVEARRGAVETAVKKKLFGRALKAEVTASPALGEEVERLLVQSALGSLGLARKAGQAQAIGMTA